MPLDDLIDSVTENKQSEVGTDNEAETSSLFNDSRVKKVKEKLNNPELCPRCGSNETEKKLYYRRCRNKDCDTITYIPVKINNKIRLE